MVETIGSPVDLSTLPAELAEKLTPKKRTLDHPGSFKKIDPELAAKVGSGVGSKAPENAKFAPPKIEDDEPKKKGSDSDLKQKLIDDMLNIAEKTLTEFKYKRINDIVHEPDDIAGQLGIKFTEDDIEEYLFKNEIAKDIDVLKNGRVVVTLKTLKKRERDEIEVLLNKAQKLTDDEVATQRGINNFRQKRLIATSLQAINGNSIGTILEDKLNYLGSLSDWIYEHLVDAFNLYIFAVNEAITDKAIKKQ